MKKVIVVALTVAGVLAGTQAQARDYIRVAGDEMGAVYLDRDSITQVDDVIRSVWFVLILPRDAGIMNSAMILTGDEAKDYGNINEMQFHFDCDGRRGAKKADIIYSRTGGIQLREDTADNELTFGEIPSQGEGAEQFGRMFDLTCGLVQPAANEILSASDRMDLEARVNAPAG